jgi:plastocyanin
MDTRTRTPAPPLPRHPWSGALVLVLALLPALVLGACGTDERADIEVMEESAGPVTHEYVIPFGTSQRIAGGEQIAIVPQQLDVAVGDTIRIRNDDAFGSQVGIFHVGAGETVTMKFTTPGTLTGACDVHPSGEFTINVEA